MKYVLVETISQFRTRYLVKTDNVSHAHDLVTMKAARKFSEKWLGETIFGSRLVDEKEAEQLFNEDDPDSGLTGREIVAYYGSEIK